MKSTAICMVLSRSIQANGVRGVLVPPPPCETLKQSAVVLVVDVSEAVPDRTTAGPSFLLTIPQTYSLKVIEVGAEIEQLRRCAKN